MGGNRQHIFLFALIITMCSCATLLNENHTRVTIITSDPARLVVNNDSLKAYDTIQLVKVDRDKKPLLITAYNDSSTKTVKVKSRYSFAYWLNAYPSCPFWLGFVIDSYSKRRYGYPRNIYIDFAKNDSTYLPYNESLYLAHQEYKSILKFTPLKLTKFINSSLELSYERFTGRIFSTQFMASWLLPNSVFDIGSEFKDDVKGYRVAIEEKYYINKSVPMGPYIAFEVDYLKNRYKDISYFGDADPYTDTASFYLNYPDTFGIKKQFIGFNLKLGYQFVSDRWTFDIYAGGGIRFKEVIHFDRINPNDEMERSRHPNIYDFANSEGKYWTFGIPLNFRVGWRF
jgi:hypothetical protein